MRSFAGTLRGVAVESACKWYWLFDGLQDAGFVVHLVNNAAVKQCDGLKYSGDFSDARHFAHLTPEMPDPGNARQCAAT